MLYLNMNISFKCKGKWFKYQSKINYTSLYLFVYDSKINVNLIKHRLHYMNIKLMRVVDLLYLCHKKLHTPIK